MNIEVLQRSLEREKAQRNLAEQLLEDKSRELYNSYEELRASHEELENAHTDVKEKQEQLVQSEKMASLGIMSAGVAHEINNPLAFVFSNINSLSHAVEQFKAFHLLIDKLLQSPDTVIPDEEKKTLETFCKDADLEYLFEDCTELIKDTVEGIQRVKVIVDGLKDFARAETSEHELVDVNQCVFNAVKIASSQIGSNCVIEERLADDVKEISGFSGKISQVILNLIVNASQALGESGHITVVTQQDDSAVIISVTDTGCGMSKETLDDIFTPFFTTKPVGHGTGLGLSVSHGIVEEHGGEITVDSELGSGTCFTIRLPLISGITDRAA